MIYTFTATPNVTGKLNVRMTTLHEETSNVSNYLSTPTYDEMEDKNDMDYYDYDAYQV